MSPRPERVEGAPTVAAARSSPAEVIPTEPRLVLDPLGVPRCAGVEVVIVSQFEDHDSVATLRGPHELRGSPQRFGGRVGDHRVVFVGEHPRTLTPTVWLLSNRRELCQAPLFGGRFGGVHAGAAAREGRAGDARDVLRQQVFAKLERVGDDHARIERGALETVLTNLDLLRGTRVDVTRPPGVRLLGARPGSVPGALGLRDGDQLLAVNGFALDDPGRVLEAWARLRTAPKLELDFERGGRRRRLTVEVVP